MSSLEAPDAQAMPRPTFWPAATAFAITLLAWSFISSAFVGLVGALVLVAALTGWVREILHENAQDTKERLDEHQDQG